MRKCDEKWEGRTDRYIFMDAGEIPGLMRQHTFSGGHWYGDTTADMIKKAEVGDEKLVAESEGFLKSIEDQLPLSRGWRNIDDVVGAIPNVPAFLAGHPQHMRRRERAAKSNAPLAIYMDLTSSGGISSANVQKRGTVLLALVRMLIEHRAVELWVGASLGQNFVSGTVAWKIDTAPLDLARSAYHIGATAMSRSFGYGLNRKLNYTHGSWPFNNYDLHVRTAEERLRKVMDGVGDILYIPPIYLTDPLTKDPVGWLKRTMKQYVNTGDE